MLKLQHPAILVGGLVLCALSFIPARKSQLENPAPNNGNDAIPVPGSPATDPPPIPESP